MYKNFLVLTFGIGILSLILSIGINYFKFKTVNFEDTVSTLMGSILSSVVIMTILYPIEFKFGATNGRYILFAVAFGITGLGMLVSKFLDLESIIVFLTKIENYLFIIIPVVSIVLVGISYMISNKIYQNKEF